MSQTLQLATYIQVVKDTINEIDNRNQICGILVLAMSTMDSADERAHYFDCFKVNKDRRNAAIKFLHERTLRVLHTLNSFFYHV